MNILKCCFLKSNTLDDDVKVKKKSSGGNKTVSPVLKFNVA